MPGRFTEVPGISSQIIDNRTTDVGVPITTPNSIIIFGTASKGPLNEPVLIQPNTVRDTFGDIPLTTPETSLVKKYYEYRTMANTSSTPIYGVRIGNAQRAYVDLTERLTAPLSGDFGVGSPPALAMRIEAIREGESYNNVYIRILENNETDPTTGTVSFVPTQVIIGGGPIEEEVTFPVNINTELASIASASVVKNIAELAISINNHSVLKKHLRATIYPLTVEMDLTIQETDSGNAETVYNLDPSLISEGVLTNVEDSGGASSWGNNLFRITTAYKVDGGTDVIPAGTTVYDRLSSAPLKDFDDVSVPTIQAFYRNVYNEVVRRTNVSQLGESLLTLSLSQYSEWISASAFGAARNKDDVEISIIRNGRQTVLSPINDITKINTTISSENPAWSIPLGTLGSPDETVTGDFIYVDALGNPSETPTSTGQIRLVANPNQGFFKRIVNDSLPSTDENYIVTPMGLRLGDIIMATYGYSVNYRERKLRSDITEGKIDEYFVSGYTVVFGSQQPYELTISYESENSFDSNTISVVDHYKSIIEIFPDESGLAVGDTIHLEYEYMPEFPASTGTTISLKNGKDGREMTALEYKNQISTAFDLTSGYPAKAIYVAGIYLDSYTSGYNVESGRPERQAVGYHEVLIDALRDKSENVKECVSFISTLPPNYRNLTPEVKSRWIRRHYESHLEENNDPTDIIRPSNIISTVDSFRLQCIVGTPIGVLPEVGATDNVVDPAVIYLAMHDVVPIERPRTNLALFGSFTNQAVPISSVETLNRMNGKRYVVFYSDPVSGQTIISRAHTLAGSRSQFRDQYVRDVTQFTVERIREIVRPFIGLPNTTQNRRAMLNKCNLELQRLAQPQAATGEQIVTNGTVNIIVPEGGEILGKSELRMSLVVARTLEQVDIYTTITIGA